jgi:hypothetical protein
MTLTSNNASSMAVITFSAVVAATSCSVLIKTIMPARKEAMLSRFKAFDEEQERIGRHTDDRGLSAKLEATAQSVSAVPDKDQSDPMARVRRQHYGVIGELLSMWFPSLFFDVKCNSAGAEDDVDVDAPPCSYTTTTESIDSTSSSSSGTHPTFRPSISFQGSGCVLVYHIGAARYVEDHFDTSNVTYLGASGGAIIAAMMAMDLGMDFAYAENCRIAKFSRVPPFGPFGRILDDVCNAFEEMLVDWSDERVANHLAGGRLVLSMTHMSTGAARLMCHYPTKRHAIDSVFCSLNLPIFACPFRRVEGEFFIDGGLTNNAPILDEHTIRVSPTDRTADVRPAEGPSLIEFLVPGNEEYMRAMHDQGYLDAKRVHHEFIKHGFRPRNEDGAKEKWVVGSKGVSGL